MSGSEKAGNGRGNNRRKPFRRRGNDSFRNDESGQHGSRASNKPSTQDKRAQGSPASRRQDDNQGRQNPGEAYKKNDRLNFPERPKWIPPKVNTEPMPIPDCPFCGKPIRDISVAIADKDTGVPVHFDCVAERIAAGENLENGDEVVYIGRGRFGIVNIESHSSFRNSDPDFKIKKIIEWEDKDKRAEWRSLICEHYSVT